MKFLIALFILLAAGAAYGQPFQTYWASFANQDLDNPADLRNQCAGGTLLPDGTPGRFVKTAQGTPGDPRVAIGDVPSSDYGYFGQTFTLNGDIDLEMPGNFMNLNPGISHSSNIYGDSYRAEVFGPTVGDSTLVWYSTPYTPTNGPQDVFKGAGQWTCEWRCFQPPSVAPANVQATDGLCNSVTVTWDLLAGATGYHVYRCNDGGGSCTRLTSTPLGSTVQQYITSTGNANTIYGFRVSAVNDCGESPQSSYDVGHWRASPAQVTGVTATVDDCFQCFITWNDISDEDSFVVWRDDIRIGSTFTDDTSFADATGIQGVTYSYVVIAWQSTCDGAPSEPALGGRRGPPDSPTGLTTSTDLCDRVIISWMDVELETGYLIRRNGQFLAFVDADTTHYVDFLSYGIHNYTVQAFNECGAGVAAGPVSGQRMTIPSVTFDTILVACQEIILQWTGSPETDWTRIYRNGLLFDSVAAPQNSFVINETLAGEYLFTVAAMNECGASEFSDTLSATIASFPQVPTNVEFSDNGCDSISVQWTNGGGSFAIYRVYRDSLLMAVVPQSATSWSDTAVIIGEQYTYWVTAYSDTCGESDASVPVVATISNSELLATPELVLVPQGQDALLVWGPIGETMNGCPAIVSGYLVFYSPEAGGPFYYHGFTTDTSYVHTRVIQFAEGMNYQVVAYAGPLARIAGFERGTPMDKMRYRLENK